jgi:hypothetical protein
VIRGYPNLSRWSGFLTLRTDDHPTVSWTEAVIGEKPIVVRVDNLAPGVHAIQISMRYGAINSYVIKCLTVKK